ncbi:UNVERIFIED_CONTAM: hypothetical protein FKN15_056703 [Acipenser sinensis]
MLLACLLLRFVGSVLGYGPQELASAPVCPPVCQCEQDGILVLVDCSELGLSAVPSDLHLLTSYLEKPLKVTGAACHTRSSQGSRAPGFNRDLACNSFHSADLWRGRQERNHPVIARQIKQLRETGFSSSNSRQTRIAPCHWESPPHITPCHWESPPRIPPCHRLK